MSNGQIPGGRGDFSQLFESYVPPADSLEWGKILHEKGEWGDGLHEARSRGREGTESIDDAILGNPAESRRVKQFTRKGTRAVSYAKAVVREPYFGKRKDDRQFRKRKRGGHGKGHMRNFRPEIPYIWGTHRVGFGIMYADIGVCHDGDEIPWSRYERVFSNEPVQTMPKIPYREIPALRNGSKSHANVYLPVEKRLCEGTGSGPDYPPDKRRFAMDMHGQPGKYGAHWSIPEPLYGNKRTPSAWKVSIAPLFIR